MIADIRAAAEACGITAVITNSKEKIETQLNRITGIESLPLMLISWDLETTLTFNEHGDLNNPETKVVILLMDKASDTTKSEAEDTAESMAQLFQQFIKALYTQLIPYQRTLGTEIISDVGYTLAPQHGMGKHSGVLGRFSMQTAIANC
mgnify:CR=1 FL=1